MHRLRRAVHSIMRRLRTPQPMPVILTYHRIADEPVDPWGLAVSPTHLEEQLEVVRRTRQPLPLTDFVRGLAAGSLPADAVALTFDDGYVDNLLVGKPRLAAATCRRSLSRHRLSWPSGGVLVGRTR